MNNEEQLECEQIIRCLKKGIVPRSGLYRFIQGREKLLEELKKDMEYIKHSNFSTKFIRGPYGSGKSLLMNVIAEKASKKNLCVAKITIGRQLNFTKTEEVYKHIMTNIKVPDSNKPSFDLVIKNWFKIMKEKYFYQVGGNKTLFREKVSDELTDITITCGGVYCALIGYLELELHRHYEASEAAIAYLKGNTNIPFNIKRLFHVKGGIDKTNVYDYLKAMIKLFKMLGYDGLVILVDEVELIRTSTSMTRMRDMAYENIRFVYDNEADFENCMWVFFGTDDLYDDNEKGIPSYNALQKRIVTEKGIEGEDYRKQVLELENFTPKDFIEIAKKVRNIHSIAHNWDASKHVKDDDLKQIIKKLSSRFGNSVVQKPRGVLKVIISILDVIQQNKKLDPQKVYSPENMAKEIEKIESEDIS